jgi:hypothetical protein
MPSFKRKFPHPRSADLISTNLRNFSNLLLGILILEEEVHRFLRNVGKYPIDVASEDLNSQQHGSLETSNVAT